MKLRVLIRENIGLRQKVEVCLPELLLHFPNVKAEPVLPGELRCAHEMVDLLIIVKVLVNILLLLGRGASPQEVPIVLVSLLETMTFQNEAHQLRLCLEYLEGEGI